MKRFLSRLAAWFKFQSTTGEQAAALPVLPFIAVLDLRTDPARASAATHPALGPADFSRVLASLQPHLTQLFVRIPASWTLEEWFKWLPTLESLELPYHLETELPWGEPGRMLGKLQSLERLDRLRIDLKGFRDLEAGASFSQLQVALAAGLKVWAVLPLEAARRQDLEARVAAAHALGIRGLSFRIPAGTSPAGELVQSLGELYQRGYPVYFEDGLPLEHPPAPDLPSDSSPREGVCYVDAYAQVWICPDAAAPLGNLLESSLESLWSVLQPPSKATVAVVQLPPLHLEESLRPLCLCDIRPDPAGALLVRGYDCMAVTLQGLKVVRAFDGQQTLRQLKRRFGQEAPPLALAMLQRGMLRFVRRDDAHD